MTANKPDEPAMRLATWNINSVRLRINLVLDFLTSADIDVLCLQETKTEDKHFLCRCVYRSRLATSCHSRREEL